MGRAVYDKKMRLEFIEKCYQLYEQKMYQAAFGILHDSGCAEDAVQEAFLKLMKGQVYFGNAESEDCKRYIITVIKHSAIDLYNKKKKEQEILCFLDGDIDGDSKGEAPKERGREEEEELKTLILGLRPKYYDVVEALALKNLSVKETSRRLGISEANVRKRFERAKKMLKVAWVKAPDGEDKYYGKERKR